jgi:hypothetical protein
MNPRQPVKVTRCQFQQAPTIAWEMWVGRLTQTSSLQTPAEDSYAARFTSLQGM